MPLDPQLVEVLRLIERAANPEYSTLSPAEARSLHNRKAPILDATRQPVHRSEDRTIAGPGGALALRLFWAREARDPMPVLVWFHGGGHVVGSLDSYDSICRRLALGADCIVASVDYRLAPEHKFPAAVEDSEAAVRWVAKHANDIGGDPARIAVGGDSAGANLAAVVAILARDVIAPPLVFQLLIYPPTAPQPDSPSHFEFDDGYLLTRRNILWFHGHYLRGDGDRNDFRYAPLLTPDLSRLPPALVIVAGYDPLRDEGIAYARRLEEAGNRVELTNYEGMVHPFFSMAGALEQARAAMVQSTTALKAAFERPPRHDSR